MFLSKQASRHEFNIRNFEIFEENEHIRIYKSKTSEEKFVVHKAVSRKKTETLFFILRCDKLTCVIEGQHPFINKV